MFCITVTALYRTKIRMSIVSNKIIEQSFGIYVCFFADPVIEPQVELDSEYKDITFINCNGRLEKNKLVLTDIAPFGFAGFEVRRIP